MNKARIVQIVGAADGSHTPHDNKYVKSWNPHTRAGILELTSTSNIAEARRFENGEEFEEWRTISNVQKTRPWDGRPNRPLTGITIHTFTAP